MSIADNNATMTKGARKSKMRHGTRFMYVAASCRCADCREANRDYQRPYMKAAYKARKQWAGWKPLRRAIP